MPLCGQRLRSSAQVLAAQLQVASTFKKNQQKELRDRLARESASKEHNRILALAMRAKIEEENRRAIARSCMQ